MQVEHVQDKKISFSVKVHTLRKFKRNCHQETVDYFS